MFIETYLERMKNETREHRNMRGYYYLIWMYIN